MLGFEQNDIYRLWILANKCVCLLLIISRLKDDHQGRRTRTWDPSLIQFDM